MRSRTTSSSRDRAVSSAVTHALALAITAILMSGLLVAAGTMLEDQRENSAREQLRTVGHRMADDLTRAAALAQDGGNVTIETRHPTRIAGKSYNVQMLTGSACQTDVISSETCLSLELQDGQTEVMVPVRNETGVRFEATAGGRYVIEATRNASAPVRTVPAYQRDLRVGVGEDLDRFDGGEDVNVTNRNPISGFTFTPGSPAVSSVIHFQNDTEDLDGVITNYEWDLGDGATRSGVNEFDYSYASAGKYTVTLTVTDDDGETDNVSKIVSVGGLAYNSPPTAIDVGGDSPSDGLRFEIENLHDSQIEIQEILIDPENDNIDSLDAAANEIEIDADDGDGGHDDSIDIYDGGVIFDMDDDGTDGAAHMSATSTADVYLRGFEDGGGNEVDMASEEVFIALRYRVGGTFYTAQFTLNGGGGGGNQPPDPAFSLVDCTDKSCDFDATASSDPDGSIDSYEWAFGDGDTASGSGLTTPTHTYAANGSYDVSLTVTDDDDVSSTVTKTISVGDANPEVVWAVNSGGPQYTDAQGITYDEDTESDPHDDVYLYSNDDAITGDPIANTTEDTLYQSERYGDFDYDIDLTNGLYEVRFKLAETYWSNDDQRVFDVRLEGSTVVSDLDLYQEVGHDYATWRTHTVTVNDGELNIDFRTEEDNAKSSAIVVRRLDPEAFQENDASPEVVSMEVENYHGRVPGNHDDYSGDDMSNDEWESLSDGSASGGAGLEALPDNGDNAGDTENGERLDYYVEFDNTGTYDVFVRLECQSGGDAGHTDSVHVGLDGQLASTGGNGLTSNDGTDCGDTNGWTWLSDADGNQVEIDVTSTGIHTFNLWMREDGARIDKIVLNKTGTDPTGTGPTESDLG